MWPAKKVINRVQVWSGIGKLRETTTGRANKGQKLTASASSGSTAIESGKKRVVNPQ